MYFAEHSVKYSPDQLNSYLSFNNITPVDIWAEAKHHVIPTELGYLLFDDRNYSSKIDMVRRQYSGNAGKIIKGIGVVTCVYVSPSTALNKCSR